MIKAWAYTIAVGLLFFSTSSVFAQNNSAESEVYLSFQYQGVVSVYVTAYYKDGEFYLPVSELFNALQIDHSVDQGSFQISGTYLGEDEYLIDFGNLWAQIPGKKLEFRLDDILIRDIDYFMKTDLFEQLFGLSFTVDFNTLSLNLETDDQMPVMARHERERKRELTQRSEYPVYERSRYPLQYDRAYSMLNGGFLDYSLSTIYTPQSQLLNMNNSIGIEALGGDFQGSSFASISADHHSFTTTNLRWRYVQRNNPFFSSAIIGQASSEGLPGRAFTGAKITNKPVEPRLLFDRYVIDGNAPPQSEVELYLNNSFVNFQQTDETGEYRFVVPLTYGSTDYSVRIYTPSGQTRKQRSRIQIPFDYIPPGKIDYSLSGGRLDNPMLGSTERGMIGEATLAAGLTRWLTAKTSAEYLSNYHTSLPSFTGSLSARLFSNYLLSADISSENFYRLSSSVIYGNGTSWSLNYDYNPGGSRLYNVGGTEQQARLNFFLPVRLGSIPLNFRWSATYQQHELNRLLRYRIYLNSRFKRLSVRLGYQDQQLDPFSLTYTPAARLTHSYTYTMGRRPGMPSYLRGMFIRGQLSYLPSFQQLEEIEFQLSRNVFDAGHLQFTYGHNFIGDFNSISLNLTVDFNRFRSNTSTRRSRSAFTVSQNIRGSLGFHPRDNQLMLNNRQQVGQAGAAVRLFVDNNNDGSYQLGIDDVIEDPAVRLDRAGGRIKEVNGINYVSQLLPYHRYDVQINKSALTNPLLVPETEQFSIVTDPNRYKPIDIPFYLSGVISGKVQQLQRNDTLQGLGGVRLYLESRLQPDRNADYFNKEIRTFSGGSFYAYEIPLGKYNLYIDPNQLNFLNTASSPDTLQLKVQALSQGDFIEDLTFTLSPQNEMEREQQILTQAPSETTGVSNSDAAEYRIQIASLSTAARANTLAKAAENRYGLTFDIIRNNSNGLFAVRTSAFSSREEAIEHLLSIQNSGFDDVALIMINSRPSIRTKESRAAGRIIQIGAFQSRQRAEAFEALSAIKLDGKTTLRYDEDLSLYTVFFSEPKDQNSEHLHEILKRVRQKSYFSDAFIKNNKDTYSPPGGRPMNFAYQVQVEGVPAESDQAFLTSILNEEDIARTNPKRDLVIFEDIDSWNKAQELRQKLSRISSAGIPIVILIEN